jgi:hypothetical protein
MAQLAHFTRSAVDAWFDCDKLSLLKAVHTFPKTSHSGGKLVTHDDGIGDDRGPNLPMAVVVNV